MKRDETDSNKGFYLSTNQVSDLLGIKVDNVNHLIRRNTFPNAFKERGIWRIPSQEFDNYKNSLKDTVNCLTVKESTKRLGYKDSNVASVLGLIKKSLLPNAFKQDDQWWIPENDIKQIEKMKLESLNVEQAYQRLNVSSRNYITVLITDGFFPNAFKLGPGWRIPLEDIENYEKLLNDVEIKEATDILRVYTKANVQNLLKKNSFPNAYKFKNSWRIPIRDINRYLSKIKDCLGTIQVAKRLGYKSEYPVHQMIEKSILPKAFKEDGQWWIPISDIEAIEKQRSQSLGIKEVVKRLYFKSGEVVMDLIHEDKFPNAFKDLFDKWRIPLIDIEEYEENHNTDNCIDIEEATERLGFQSLTEVKRMLKMNSFPNSYKFKGKSWIPLTDFEVVKGELQEIERTNQGRRKLSSENIEKNEKMLNTVGLNEAAQMLGFQSRNAVSYHVRNNKFPNAFKFNNSWRIPISDIDNYSSEIKDCLTITQVSERLSYKSVHQLIKKSILPDAFKTNGQWWIPVSNIEVIERKKSESLDATQVAQRLKLKYNVLVRELKLKEKFPNAFKDVFNKWRVPLKDVLEYEEIHNTDNCIDIEEASKRLGYQSLTKVRFLLKNNYFPGAYKSGRKTWIPLTDFEDIQEDFQKGKRREKEEKKKSKKLVDVTIRHVGYLDSLEVKKRFKVSRYAIVQRMKKGGFIKAFSEKGELWISEADVKKWEEEIEENIRLKKSTLSISEVANRLGKTYAVVFQMVGKTKRFPNAFKVNGYWRLPITDVDEVAMTLKESTKKVDYTPKKALAELSDFMDPLDINENLKETKALYKQFCLLQINNMSGTSKYKRSRVRTFKSLYAKLMTTIKSEVYFVPSDVISSMLGESSVLRQHEKKILIVFLRHVYHHKNIEPEEEFSLISTTENKKQQDIYSPELFNSIYLYTKDIERHRSNALRDRSYANMWVYTILLLTDFIRGQDLILNTPNIDLETVNIYSFDWFSENEVSKYQSQTIINQLYAHYRYKRTSKTDELLTFIVAPDLIVPLATALIISEIHREISKSDLLLDSFLQGKYNDVKTQGKARHQNFFNELQSTAEFRFSSLMMNRSVATYLFYSITEEEGQDSDLALHLTQVSRSHKSTDSTSTYIQATNKDGSINRVSYNLFKRGHFGWLYNYIILYVSQFEGTQDTLEQRSKLIEEVRKEINPSDLEGVAKFVNNTLATMPLNRNSDSMDTFLQNIYKKRQTVISKLNDYSKEEIRDIIIKLSNGDLPSKNEHAQCLVAPKCKNPKLTNCFSCEYVIPGNLMLIQLNEELNRLVKNIENETNELILQRESRFLMHTLFIWREARIEFGDEKVNAYISAEEKWAMIENVSHKIIVE